MNPNDSGHSSPTKYSQQPGNAAPTVTYTDSDPKLNFALGARSASPAKRSASERDEDEHLSTRRGSFTDPTINISNYSGRSPHSPQSPKRPNIQHTSPMPSRFKAIMAEEGTNPTASRSVEMMNSDSDTTESISHHQDTEMVQPSLNFTPARSTEDEEMNLKDLPSLDEQTKMVTELVNDEQQLEGQKGYVISASWLARVESRTAKGQSQSFPKAAREGSIGPIDNSDIVETDEFYANLRNVDGASFVPLKLGSQIGEDFQVLPQQAWDLVVGWYGIRDERHVIVRYMHNTSPPDADMPNFQYELFPPIFTIQKIPDTTDPLSVQQMKDKGLHAVNVVANRGDKFQSFLARAKTAANIPLETKVRVWKVSEPTEARDGRATIPTPASSRSASPVNLARTRLNLVVDVNAFTNMTEGVERESLGIKDETNNEKYNGSSTIGTIGFPERQLLVLEEQVSNTTTDEFVTDQARKSASQQGIELAPTKKGLLASGTSSRSGSARGSPAPSGIMTRGRATKRGRTKGCTGLSNLGNTCYMNSALQCVRSVEELTLYFLSGKAKTEINADNPLGYHGAVAKSYETLLSNIYDTPTSGSFAPRNFKSTLGRCQPLFSGYSQQDSQEFLSFLVDGLHEDLNRVLKKPYIENPESDDKTVDDVEAIRALGEKFKSNHRARNDSVAMDLFNGFYKNTMVCPICAKVSITFDPYSSVTLQLPFDSPWTHKVTFCPLNEPPVNIEVDIDRNSNVRMLKEYIAKRVKSGNPTTFMMAEDYGDKFYRIFDDSEVLSEANIQSGETIIVYELEKQPTNWPISLQDKTFMSRSFDSDMLDRETGYGDRMVIPILHRLKPSLGLGLLPLMVLITRDEAKDYDSILKKVLRRVQTLTTKPLFEDVLSSRQTSGSESSDAVQVVDENEGSSEGTNVQAHSVQSEDGLVDVSMKDSTQESNGVGDNARIVEQMNTPQSNVYDSTTSIPQALRSLFSMHVFSNNNESIPTTFTRASNPANVDNSILARAEMASSSQSQSQSRGSSRSDRSVSSDTSEDELGMTDAQEEIKTGSDTDSDEDDALAPRIPRTRNETYRNQREVSPRHFQRRKLNHHGETIDDYLVRLGEGIVLEWEESAIDALFEGSPADEMRGQPTFKSIPTVKDPELESKRTKRAARRKTGVSLEECFAETSKTEILSEENAWYCSRCKELRRASKTLELWTVPDILMIHLKRFRSSRTLRDKMDIMVDAPVEGLDLSDRVGLPEDKSLVYDLFAVDNHYGGLGGGHYTAYAKNFYDKKWYNYNDNMVSSANPDSVVSKDAYLLFYRRRSDKPLGSQYLQDIVSEYWNETNESGEDQRQDDSSSLNGSSSDSHGVSAGRPRGKVGRPPGRGAGGGRRDHEKKAKSALLRDLPPPYANQRETGGSEDGKEDEEDEGIADMDENADDALPSYESEEAAFIGPAVPVNYTFDQPTWSWPDLQGMGDGGGGSGAQAPPGSERDNMSESSTHVAASDAPEMGDLGEDRMLEDFGDELDEGVNAHGEQQQRLQNGADTLMGHSSPTMDYDEGHVSSQGFGVIKLDNTAGTALGTEQNISLNKSITMTNADASGTAEEKVTSIADATRSKEKERQQAVAAGHGGGAAQGATDVTFGNTDDATSNGTQ